jgi:hypothetical protein
LNRFHDQGPGTGKQSSEFEEARPGDKPQIAQVSQSTEAAELDRDHCKNFLRRKIGIVETLDPPPLLCEIGAIGGFKFGI